MMALGTAKLEVGFIGVKSLAFTLKSSLNDGVGVLAEGTVVGTGGGLKEAAAGLKGAAVLMGVGFEDGLNSGTLPIFLNKS